MPREIQHDLEALKFFNIPLMNIKYFIKQMPYNLLPNVYLANVKKI